VCIGGSPSTILLVPHRDDRDAAQHRIAALERRLADAEAEREEAEAELARSEQEREALERKLRGEPSPDEKDWTRDEFAKRVMTEAPRVPLDLWPARPAPVVRSSAAPDRESTRATRTQAPASRVQVTVAFLVSALAVHLPWLLWIDRIGDSMTPATMDAMRTAQLVGAVLQTLLHFLVVRGLRVPRPRAALTGAALMSVFSALLMGMLAGGPLIAPLGLTGMAIALHGYVVAALARGERM